MSTEPFNEEQKKIVQWLKKVRFRKSLFGVSEKDIWKKISELDELYQQALNAERVRFDALLEEYKKNGTIKSVSSGEEREVEH